MILRGKRIFARCEQNGDLRAVGGRVEIRYKRNDGRAYQAALRNLDPADDAQVFADDHCGEASAAPSSKGKATKGKSKGSKAGSVKPPSAPEGDEVLAFCDGACSGNPGPAGAGVVLLWDDQRKVLSEYLGRGTNNIGELTAIMRAAEGTPDPKRKMRIFTDSTYSIGVLTKGWKAKANQELIASVKAALAKLDNVELFYVKGHAGIELNEVADRLAVQAVEQRGTTPWKTVG